MPDENEAFRTAVLAQYDAPAASAARAEVARHLDESLRQRFAALWTLLLGLEYLIADRPTGDPDAIIQDFQGELDRVVELWKQSLLDRPRVVLPALDREFGTAVQATYASAAAASTADNIGRQLGCRSGILFQVTWCSQ